MELHSPPPSAPPLAPWCTGRGTMSGSPACRIVELSFLINGCQKLMGKVASVQQIWCITVSTWLIKGEIEVIIKPTRLL